MRKTDIPYQKTNSYLLAEAKRPKASPPLLRPQKKRLSLRSFFSLLSVCFLILCASFFAGAENAGSFAGFVSAVTKRSQETFLPENTLAWMFAPAKKKEAAAVPAASPSDAAPADPAPPAGAAEEERVTETSVELFAGLYDCDLSQMPEGLLPIVPYDLSSERDGALSLYNDTDLSIRAADYANRTAAFAGLDVSAAAGGADAPVVLIVHTHGTEAYSEEGAIGYSETYNIPRSADVTKNVVAIGEVIAQKLREAGIPVLHSTVMHDKESYLGSYERSAATIEKYLEEYPSIRYVFDVHRDSVLKEDGTKIRPVTVAKGQVAAQIMSVCGTDGYGAYHPNWENNFEFAAKLQKNLNAHYLGLARAICLRKSAYNQELAPCSMLFEVGSCGNTLAEAKVSAEILGEELSAMILAGW
ncbi:MAG: stage II sporulation protein P [Clostridia bacterium]|nr:stage II sporulation protein P [Clostridia bacterium]